MELTPGDFNRLGICLEGFLFGIYDKHHAPSLLTQSDIAPSQDSILAFLPSFYNMMHHEKATIREEPLFSMLSACYMLYLWLSLLSI